jgi:hypothetical protein
LLLRDNRRTLRRVLKKPSGKAAASEEARRYGPHFVEPFALLNSSWQTEKLLTCFRSPRKFLSWLNL